MCVCVLLDVQQAFNAVDTNHDGRIDAKQLLQVAKLVGVKVMSVHHAQALITKYGSRGRAEISRRDRWGEGGVQRVCRLNVRLSTSTR